MTFLWGSHSCYYFDDILEFALEFILVINEFDSQFINFLPHDLLLHFMLSYIVINSLVHSTFWLGEPEKHVRVFPHFTHEVLQIEKVLSKRKRIKYPFNEAWINRSYRYMLRY